MEQYTEKYHNKLHKHLLSNKAYYEFRAKYSSKTYLRYLHGRVFEFGCGIGQNIYNIKDKAIGIDISEFAIRECNKRGVKAVNKVEALKGSYDGCLSVHVMEHLENPSLILKRINSRLKKNGRLVLVLPVLRRNVPENRDFGSDISRHIYYWNFSAINSLLVNSGFKIMLNKFNYARGFSLFYSLPFKLANFFVRFFGFITNTKEMVIVAEKSF